MKIIGRLASCLALCFAMASVSLSAQQADAEKSPTRLRFRSGWVLCAEIAPDDPERPFTIANVCPYEPESVVKDSPGYAAVCVRLDSDRSLGRYDFVLEDGAKRQYPCVALRVDDKVYDGGTWQFEDTGVNRRYSLLFRVPLRPGADPEYTLKFVLFGEDPQAPILAFRRVESTDQFTVPSTILDEGVLGVEPVPAVAPEVAVEAEGVTGEGQVTGVTAVAEAPDAAVAAAPPPATPPPATPRDPDGPAEPPKKPTAAELEEWNKVLAGAVTTPPAAPTPAAGDPAPTAVPDGTSMIRYYPRSPVEVRMLGGVFEGTNGDPNTGPYTVIHTIAATPVNDWNEVKVDLGTWRYLRYRGPANSNCNVNEIEFYRNGKKLVGTPFGTAGSHQDGGNTFDKAFDGNTSTFFDAPIPDGAYVGIDTAPAAAAAPAARQADVAATPAAGWDDWK
jgi:hypothetical protein